MLSVVLHAVYRYLNSSKPFTHQWCKVKQRILIFPPQDEEYAHQLQSELDPVLHVQDIYDQISSVSHILLFILVVHVSVCVPNYVAVTDLLPPQDEEYACQLQSELDVMSDIEACQIFAVSHISLKFDLTILRANNTVQYSDDSCPS